MSKAARPPRPHGPADPAVRAGLAEVVATAGFAGAHVEEGAFPPGDVFDLQHETNVGNGLSSGGYPTAGCREKGNEKRAVSEAWTACPSFPDIQASGIQRGSLYLSVTSPSPSILPVAVLPGGTNWQATMLPVETIMPFFSRLPWSPSLLASQASEL